MARNAGPSRASATPAQISNMRNTERRLLRVIEFIHTAPSDELSLDRLADVAAMSRFHFHRVFHAVMGETAAQATRRILLYRAAMQLVQSSRAIDAIAKETGYATVPAFSRAFRTAFGLPPGQFRQNGHLGPLPGPLTPGDRKMTTALTFDVTLENLPNRRLATLSHSGDYMEIGKTFEKLSLLANSRAMWPDVDAMVGVYFDDPDATETAELRSLAGLALTADATIAEPLEEYQLEGGKTAVLLFKGPYAGLHGAYKFLYGVWLPGSGHEARDMPPYEVYLNAPADTAPEDLLTQICLPLAG